MPVAGNSELRKDVIELTPCGLVNSQLFHPWQMTTAFITLSWCVVFVFFFFFLFPSKFEMGENVVKTVKCGMLKLGFVVN